MRLNRSELRKMILKEMRAGVMMGGRASSVDFDLDAKAKKVFPYLQGQVKDLSEMMRSAVMRGQIQGGYERPFLRLADELPQEVLKVGSVLRQTGGMQIETDGLLKKLQLVLRVCSDYKQVTRNPRDRFCTDVENAARQLIGMIMHNFG